MEVTKWLKPSESVPRIGGSASVQADPTTLSGKADMVGWMSEDDAQALHRGSGSSMYTRKAQATREAPRSGQGWPTGCP